MYIHNVLWLHMLVICVLYDLHTWTNGLLFMYRIAGELDGNNVWWKWMNLQKNCQSAKRLLIVITRFWFGKSLIIRQIHLTFPDQTFLLYGTSSFSFNIRYSMYTIPYISTFLLHSGSALISNG